MGRALSFSLLAHALFALSFLLLSATRQPLRVVPAARPVRLVTYLEPAPAPRSRTASGRAPSARAVPTPPAARAPAAAATAPIAPAASRSPAAVAVPRVIIPTPEGAARAPGAAPAAAAPSPAFGERLARRLASTAPAGTATAEPAAPSIASLPPIHSTAEPPAAATAPEAAGPFGQRAPTAPRGAVEPVGYFPHAWYLALLKEEVYARWSPPSEYFQSRRPPVALVSFRITRAGEIEAVALKEGSGSARFDQSALAAVRGLGAVPALPGQYTEESLNVVIRFQNQR